LLSRPLPRPPSHERVHFITTSQHTGFVECILRTGGVTVQIDAVQLAGLLRGGGDVDRRGRRAVPRSHAMRDRTGGSCSFPVIDPGLYFTGPPSATTFGPVIGPVMRFVRNGFAAPRSRE
jgi:hypothetical protein